MSDTNKGTLILMYPHTESHPLTERNCGKLQQPTSTEQTTESIVYWVEVDTDCVPN